MFIVETTSSGIPYFLRGTTWTCEPTRASTFDDQAAARAALDKARKFTKPAIYKAAEIKTA